MKKKKRNYTILGVTALGATALTATLPTYHSLTAQAAELGYDNVLKFTTKSTTSTSTSTETKHEPMDLIQIVDLSGSLSEAEFPGRNGYSGAREQQFSDMIYTIRTQLSNEDHVMLAFYGTNSQISYAVNSNAGGIATRLLTKDEAITLLEQIGSNRQVNTLDKSWMLIPQVVKPMLAGYIADAPAGSGFEDVYMSQPNRNKRVSVLQFTDDWIDSENIDTSFANWATKNAKTFMTVVDNGQSSESYSTLRMKAAGHSNILVFNSTSAPNRQSRIAEQFNSTATVKITTSTTTHQTVNVQITPDADVTLKSAELVDSKGKKTPLTITGNKVDFTQQLPTDSYSVNYTFEGSPSVERNIRSSVTVDGKKVDEKVNTLKPEVVKFNTTYENDPNLPAGKEVEKRKGVEGKVLKVIKDGKEVASKQLIAKVDRIIARGTKGSDVETNEVDIPFDTKYINDPELESGKTRVVKEGVVGKKQITKTYVTQSGKRVGNPTVTEKVTKEKVDKVVARGTKGSDVETNEIDIPFDTKYIDDLALEAGKTRVVTEGVVGKKQITKTYVTQSGKRVGDPSISEKVTKEKVDKVIARGTKGAETDLNEIDIPFDTKYVNDPSLEVGVEKVVTEGVIGKKQITKVYVTQSGKRVGDPTVTEQITKEKVDKVIARGTRSKVIDNSEIKEIPFETKYVADPELPAGEQVVDVEGVIGKIEVVKTYVTIAGEKQDNPTIEENVLTEKVDKVVRVGIKPVVTHKEIPFETSYVDDPELEFGVEKVVTEGVVGDEQTTVEYELDEEHGVALAKAPKIEIVKEKVDKVIAKGTKGSVSEKSTKEIPFTTKYVADETLEAGVKVTKTKGVTGQIEVTKSWVTQKEEKVGEPVVTEKTTVEKVDEVIVVGTKPVITKEDIPFDTEYIEDPELDEGKTRVVSEGSLGESQSVKKYTLNVETGEVSELPADITIPKQKSNRIIAKGTKKKPEPKKLPKTSAEAIVGFSILGTLSSVGAFFSMRKRKK